MRIKRNCYGPAVLIAAGLLAGCRDEPTVAEWGPERSGVKIDMSQGWCGEHSVPESVCTRCNPELIEKFKAAQDWCAGHDLPESQCEACNPGVNAKWAAIKEDGAAATAPGASRADPIVVPDKLAAIRVEHARQGLLRPNDPLCTIGQLQIRFADPTIAAKAGIEAEPAQRRSLSASLACTGAVRFDQTRLAHVTPRIAGVVYAVRARLGDQVAPGDVLAVVESPKLGQFKSVYIEREQNLLLAKDELERHDLIHAGTETLLAACTVEAKSEAVRARLEGVRVGEPKRRLLQAHARLELARATFERQTRLRGQDLSTEQALETAQAEISTARADFSATREIIAFELERAHVAARTAVRAARIALDAARRQLVVLGVTEEQIAALEADSAGRTLSRLEIRSPIAGRIIERHAVIGESVTEEDALFSVADVSSMWLMLDVPERNLVDLRLGLPVLFTVDGLRGHAFEGKLDWIGSQVDDRARTVKARAPLDNAKGLLRANMFGRGRLVLHDAESLLTVPRRAVQTDGCCQLVFVRLADDLYQPRKVTLGVTVNDYVAIHDGLAVGDAVVTTGSFLLKTEILKGNIGAGCCEVDPGR